MAALRGRTTGQRPHDAFLAWCCERLAAGGVTTTLVLVWDNASWHVSGAVRAWLREHNQRVHRDGGVRIIPCFLPSKSPWLNPIEPKWVHGKRRVARARPAADRPRAGGTGLRRLRLSALRSLGHPPGGRLIMH